MLLRPTISCCTETCAASSHSGSAERWQTASAITPAAIQPAAKISTAMLRAASASGCIHFDAQFSADSPPPLWRLSRLLGNCFRMCRRKKRYLERGISLLMDIACYVSMLVRMSVDSVSRTRRFCVTHGIQRDSHIQDTLSILGMRCTRPV